MAKGGGYEREVAKKLSLWWTNGKDDFVFRRTSNSGGRATVRGRKGQQTKAHAGDLGVVGSKGKALTGTVTIEIKRGYNKEANLHTLLDHTDRDAVTVIEKWVWQAASAAERANTPYRMIIHRRDRREPLVILPLDLIVVLTAERYTDLKHLARVWCSVRQTRKIKVNKSLVVMKLDYFLKHVRPADVKALYKLTKRDR